MEETTQKILETLLTTIKETKDFTMEQAPILAQEIVNYAIAANGVCLLIALLASIISIFTLKNFNKSPDREPAPLWLLGFIISFTIAIILLFKHFPELIKAMVAPRLYIIEAIKDLL